MSKPTVLFTLAGLNSRLFPFNGGVHKSGLTLLGQPLIVQTVQRFVERGYQSFVIVVSPQDDPQTGIRALLTTAFPKLNLVFVEQHQAKGMGDAVLSAQQHLDGPFIYTSGYHVQAADIADQMMALPTPNGVCSTATSHPWDYGVLTIQNGLATGITEKPPRGTEASNQRILTIYWLDKSFLDTLAHIDEHDHYSFETALNILMEKKQVGHLPLPQALASLKYPWHLFDLQSELFTQLKSFRDPTARISQTAILDETEGPIVIEAGARVGDFAKIVGPSYIGRECLVGDYAFVRHSSVEAHTSIGAKTEVARSLLMSHSSVHFGYVADSLIGNRVKIGAGLITANKRLDRHSVTVEVKGQPIDTGRVNVGVIIGDQANLGIRVSTMPGVIIGPQATIFPSMTLYHSIAAQTVVK